MRIAVITAAGQGTRVGHPLPKQFIKVGGSTIVEYSIKKFLEIGYDRVIVALPAKGFATYRDMLTDDPRVDYIPGGLTANESRYIGVSHAAGYIRGENAFAVVAVHDGVRPLFSPVIAIKCTRMCENDTNRAAVVPKTQRSVYTTDVRTGGSVEVADSDGVRSFEIERGIRESSS